MVRLMSNFQGQPNSLQVIFGQAFWTPGPSGSGPDPKKWVFCQIYLLPGFWGRGVVLHLFGIGTTRQKNVGSGILIFGPRHEKTGPEGGAGGRGDQNFGISIFFVKRTPPKIRRRSLFVLCNFLIRGTPRAPGVPQGPRRVKIKSQNWGIFIEGIPPEIKF